MIGKKSKFIARLHPKIVVINPNVKPEKIAPRVLIEPSQESCSFVSGPVFKGVKLDIRIGVAGDIQPVKFQLLYDFLGTKLKLNLD